MKSLALAFIVLTSTTAFALPTAWMTCRFGERIYLDGDKAYFNGEKYTIGIARSLVPDWFYVGLAEPNATSISRFHYNTYCRFDSPINEALLPSVLPGQLLPLNRGVCFSQANCKGRRSRSTLGATGCARQTKSYRTERDGVCWNL